MEPLVAIVDGAPVPNFPRTVNVRKKGVLASGQNTVEVWITELNGAQLS
jgi:hypothetical protein